jgi:hypothetical protein
MNHEKKARSDRTSASEVNVYLNNQDMIAIIAVQPNTDDKFVSRS